MALFGLKRKKTQFERYDGFRTKINYSCKGELKNALFDLPEPINQHFLEYLKPFGYPILIARNHYEISRENFFRLMIVIGRNSFQARFTKNCDIRAKELLIQQIQLALGEQLPSDLPTRCPENALNVSENYLKIDLTKCAFCLECV